MKINKQLSYWLKGCIIGFIVSFIYILTKIILYKFDKYCYPLKSKMCGNYDPSRLPPTIIENFFMNWKDILPNFLIILVIGVIIGALIGYIYGKYKKNKN